MAGWTLLVYLFITALMAPVLIATLNWSIFRGDRLVVGNTELYTWFFSPSGFIYLFVALLIALTALVIRYAGLFQIVTDHLLEKPVSVRNTVLHIVPRIPTLLKLCIITIFGAVLFLIPLLAGLGIIYLSLLTDFDIHYYLLTTPPEWYKALNRAAVWAGIWSVITIITLACLLPALPAYLDGNKSVRQSILDVWHAPLSKTLMLVKSAGVAGSIWVLLRITADATLFFIFSRAAGWLQSDTESLRLIAFFTGNYLFLTLAVGAVISFFGFSMISVLITKYYYNITQPFLQIDIPGFRQLTQKTLRVITWWMKPFRASLLLLIIVSGGIIASLIIANTEQDDLQILNIAHRANAMGAPENSFAGLENSIRAGADMAEIDVQLTSDGVAVVLHDADLMRVAGDPRRVSDITYTETRELHLISDRDLPDELLRIPSLDKFLDRSQNRLPLLIELKYYGTDTLLAERVVELIRQKGMSDQVLLMSLNLQAVQQVRQIAPDIAAGYTSAVAAGDLNRLSVNFLAVYYPNITPLLVNRLSERGQPVFAWTVNNPRTMLEAIEKGVGGLITDDPELAAVVIDQVSALSRAERLLLQFGLIIFDRESLLAEESE